MSSKIENVKKELLSDNWYVLHKYTFDLKRKNGGSVQQMREVYDRGNGATILLYNRAKGTVVLTNQFRMPTYVNGNESGMLLEACAGLLDADSPEQCARREAVEKPASGERGQENLRSLHVAGRRDRDRALLYRRIP